MDLLLLEFCSGPIADESLHLLGKYSNVDVESNWNDLMFKKDNENLPHFNTKYIDK